MVQRIFIDEKPPSKFKIAMGWLVLVAVAAFAFFGASVLFSSCATPPVYYRYEGDVEPPPVIDPTPAPSDAVAYSLIEQITPGMTAAELRALLGAPDTTSDTTWIYQNATNSEGHARTLRVEVWAGRVAGHSLWMR